MCLGTHETCPEDVFTAIDKSIVAVEGEREEGVKLGCFGNRKTTGTTNRISKKG